MHTEYAMLAVYKIEALRLGKECHSVQSNRKFSLEKLLYIFEPNPVSNLTFY